MKAFFLLLFLAQFYSYGQDPVPVWIEDSGKGFNNNYMSHPDYGKNRKKFRELGNEIEIIASQNTKDYHTLRKPAFIHKNGSYSKDKLNDFIQSAKLFQTRLNDNSAVYWRKCNERKLLEDKVLPKAPDVDKCKLLRDQINESINYDISRAQNLIKDINNKN